MKRFLALCLLWPSTVWADPDQTIATPNTFVSGTTASASEVNANFNEHQSKFNDHGHADITETTSNSLEIGNATTTGNKRIIADTGASNRPEIRYNTTSSTWQRSDDGTTFTDLSTAGGLTGGTPALTLGTTNSAGVATTGIRTDATIAAFDGTVPVTQAFGDAAATGSATVAARRDHTHGMPASPANDTKINTVFASAAETIGAASASTTVTASVTPDVTSTVIVQVACRVNSVGGATSDVSIGIRRTTPSATTLAASLDRADTAAPFYVTVTSRETGVSSGTARTYALWNDTGGSGLTVQDASIIIWVIPE